MTNDLTQIAIQVHNDNVKAGWWTDLATGESMLRTRNRPEMLMLAISEIAEAADGIYGAMDDKLPHLPMYDVELADFVIRMLDLIGAEVTCGISVRWQNQPTVVTQPHYMAESRTWRLMEIVRMISRAMECYRKGRHGDYLHSLTLAVQLAFLIADAEKINLWDAIEQKRAFNRIRADHKPENRVKDGGKAF